MKEMRELKSAKTKAEVVRTVCAVLALCVNVSVLIIVITK